MSETKPLESGPLSLSHTGHGAASVIPHLREREPLLPPQLQYSIVDEAFSEQQLLQQPGSDAPSE